MSKSTSIKYLLGTISYLTCLVLIYNIFMPIRLNASNNGPSQPEYTGFEPVGNTQMVDEFTGQFTYNIPIIEVPGPQGSSFPLSISYHSGQSPEADASWVGYGWTLNPGAIIRNTKGYPDDYKETEITYIDKPRQNITVRDYWSARLEYSSEDLEQANASVQFTKSFNTLGGMTRELGFSVGVTYDYFGGEVSGNSDGLSFGFVPSKKLMDEVSDLITKINLDKGLTDLSTYLANGLVKNGMDFLKIQPFSPFNSYPLTLTSQKGIDKYFKTNGRINITTYLPAIEGDIPVFTQISKSQPINYENKKKVNGYFYSGDVENIHTVMDYYCEKESGSYIEKDKYLPIPFSNPDMFTVTASGLSGTFRFWNKHIGQFRPDYTFSKVSIYEGEVGVNASAEPGVGIGAGYNQGSSSSQILANDKVSENFNSYKNGENNVFPTFINDMGGSLEYQSTDVLAHYHIDGNGYSEDFNDEYSDVRKKSKFIGFNFSSAQKSEDNVAENIELYCVDPKERVSNSSYMKKDQISSNFKEFNIVNESGVSYTFGLPVYSKNEYNINYGLDKYTKADFYDNEWFNKIIYLEKEPNIESNEVITGYIRPQQYANTFLLTSITGSNYIDLTLDGVSHDDLGSWTRFNYHLAYGGTKEWYKWRQPYTGLNYNRGSKSDLRDDVGSYSSGEKEIYYLESIETKTHIAFFVTNKTTIKNTNGVVVLQGSDSERKDACPAAEEIDASKGKYYNPTSNNLELLEKIVLYPKNRDGGVDFSKPIKTVNFQYDYSSWSGQPSSIDGVGKLTLKRIWFDYGDEQNNSVSPYQFSYAYDDDGNGNFESDEINYSNTSISSQLPSGGVETPDYNPQVTDAWGNYNPALENEYKYGRHWTQQLSDAYSDYDLSAWQLKKILLPTGGQIHVQYEQNEYSYVQDKPVKTAFRLTNDEELTHKEIKIDLSKTIDLTDVDINAYVSQLQKYCLLTKPVYFKFLYKLWENYNVKSPEYNSQNVDYVDGYLYIKDITRVSNTNSIILDISPTVWTTGAKNFSTIPNSVAKSMVKHYKNFMWFDPVQKKLRDEAYPNITGGAFETKYFDEALARSFLTEVSGKDGKDIETQTCQSILADYSYLRLPLPSETTKKGGGIRVKRLILVDKLNPSKQVDGLDNIYGMEYRYFDGVASSEPLSIPEDNSLKEHIEKNELEGDFQDWLAGIGYYKYEGPFGETLLPGPSVSYSRVQVLPINSSITVPYVKEKIFNTYKDYPYFVKDINTSIFNPKNYKNGVIGSQYSNLESNKPWFNEVGDYIFNAMSGFISKKFTDAEFPIGFGVTIKNDKISVSQGFRFIKQNMHGKIKEENSYIVKYDKSTNSSKMILNGSTKYEYFNIGEQLEGFDGNTLTKFKPGKQQEIVFETRKYSSIQSKDGAELDFTFKAWGWPDLSGKLKTSKIEKEINTVTSSSITSYPAIVKKVTTLSKEKLETHAENLAFDPTSLQPLIVRTTDEYNEESSANGKIYQVSIPGDAVYPGIGMKSLREGTVISSSDKLKIHRRVENRVYSPSHPLENIYSLRFDFANLGKSVNHKEIVSTLLPGDVIKVYSAGDEEQSFPEYYNVTYAYGDYITMIPIGSSGINTYVPITESEKLVDIRIIKSTRKNILGTAIGNLSIYSDDDLISTMKTNSDKVYHPQYFTDDDLNAKNIFIESLNNVLNRYKKKVQSQIIPAQEFIDEAERLYNNTSVSGLDIDFIDIERDTVSVNLEDLFSNKIIVEHIAPLQIFYSPTESDTLLPSNPHTFRLKVDRDLSGNKLFSTVGSNNINQDLTNNAFLKILNEFYDNAWTYTIKAGNNNVVDLFEEHTTDIYRKWNLIKESSSYKTSTKQYAIYKATTSKSSDIYELLNLDKVLKVVQYPFTYHNPTGGSTTYYSEQEMLKKMQIYYAVDLTKQVSISDFDTQGNLLSSVTKPSLYIVAIGLKLFDDNSSEWIGFGQCPAQSNVANTAQGIFTNLYADYVPESGSISSTSEISFNYHTDFSILPTIEIVDSKFSTGASGGQESFELITFDNSIDKDYCEMILTGSPDNMEELKEKYQEIYDQFYQFNNDEEKCSFIFDHLHDLFYGNSIEYFKIDESRNGLLVNKNIRVVHPMFWPSYGTKVLAEYFPSGIINDICMFTYNTQVSVDASTEIDRVSYTNSNLLSVFAPKVNNVYSGLRGRNSSDIFYIADDITPLEFARKIFYSNQYTNVRSASAVTLNDEWSGKSSVAENPYFNGSKGRWHIAKQFYYRNDPKMDYSNADVTTSGKLLPTDFKNNLQNSTSNTFEMIPWQFMDFANSTENWKLTSINKNYTINGQVTEVEDMIGNTSCKQYVYNDQVPKLTATFANNDEVLFTSFEDIPVVSVSSNWSIDNVEIESNEAHTGGNCASAADIHFQKSSDKMYYLKFWIKNTDETQNFQDYQTALTNAENMINMLGISAVIENMIPCGEWTLITATIPSSVTDINFNISLFNAPIDDIAIYPVESSVSFYVYNEDDLSINAAFDNTHLATLFNYNLRNELVSVRKETYQGIKTISTSSINLQKVAKAGAGTGFTAGAISSGDIETASKIIVNKNNNLPFLNIFDTENPTEKNNDSQFDLLNINIGPDGIDLDVFKPKEIDKINEIDKNFIPQISRDSLSTKPILDLDPNEIENKVKSESENKLEQEKKSVIEQHGTQQVKIRK